MESVRTIDRIARRTRDLSDGGSGSALQIREMCASQPDSDADSCNYKLDCGDKGSFDVYNTQVADLQAWIKKNCHNPFECAKKAAQAWWNCYETVGTIVTAIIAAALLVCVAACFLLPVEGPLIVPCIQFCEESIGGPSLESLWLTLAGCTALAVAVLTECNRQKLIRMMRQA
jgi:hypothetical protein